MKRLRLLSQRSASQWRPTPYPFQLSPATCQPCHSRRSNSTLDGPSTYSTPATIPGFVLGAKSPDIKQLEKFPSPPPALALKSAKLASLHARLQLSSDFPVQTLARCLIDRTADPDVRFNNTRLARLGEDVIGYYCAEHLICQYPRLPVEVIWEAKLAYVGPDACADIVREWGVEGVAAPGGEVDPGLLQFKQPLKTQPHYEAGYMAKKKMADRERALPRSMQKAENIQDGQVDLYAAQRAWAAERRYGRITNMHRILFGDSFGMKKVPERELSDVTNIRHASMSFVRALIGAIHLHSGASAAKKFFHDHVLSRSLDLAKLIAFDKPRRDLTVLCLREGFEPPVARLISETGRASANSVFVVGIYSGRDKLGEAVGGSLEEAKIRATVVALKAWYLYSPLEVSYPSETESEEGRSKWKPNMVDWGEVIV